MKHITTYYADSDKAKCEVLLDLEASKCVIRYYNSGGFVTSTEVCKDANIEKAEQMAEDWIIKYNKSSKNPDKQFVSIINKTSMLSEKSERNQKAMRNIFFP